MTRISLASIFLFLAIFCSFSFTSPIKPRDFNGLQTDMNQLAVDVASLVNGIESVGTGTGITIAQEAAVFLQVKGVEGDLSNCVKDVSGILNVTEDEANAILTIVQGIVPGVLDALGVLINKKPIFAQLYIPVPIIHGELITVENGVLALGDALIPLAPPDLQPIAINIRSQLKTAFDAAIVAYSS